MKLKKISMLIAALVSFSSYSDTVDLSEYDITRKIETDHILYIPAKGNNFNDEAGDGIVYFKNYLYQMLQPQLVFEHPMSQPHKNNLYIDLRSPSFDNNEFNAFMIHHKAQSRTEYPPLPDDAVLCQPTAGLKQILSEMLYYETESKQMPLPSICRLVITYIPKNQAQEQKLIQFLQQEIFVKTHIEVTPEPPEPEEPIYQRTEEVKQEIERLQALNIFQPIFKYGVQTGWKTNFYTLQKNFILNHAIGKNRKPVTEQKRLFKELLSEFYEHSNFKAKACMSKEGKIALYEDIYLPKLEEPKPPAEPETLIIIKN